MTPVAARRRVADQRDVGGHAEAQLRVGPHDLELDEVRACRGVSRGRDVADARFVDLVRRGPQAHARRARFAHGGDLAFRHRHHGIECFEPRDAHDGLTGRDDLPGIGEGGGDDARGVGAQFGVLRLVAGDGRLRAGGIAARGGGVERIAALVVRGLADVLLGEQLAVAFVLVAREGVVGLGLRDLRLRRRRVEPQVLGIEPREQVALVHAFAEIGRAREQLAADAERDVRLIARTDLAREHREKVTAAGLRAHHLHWPHRLDLFRRLAAARDERRGGERGDEHGTLHAALRAATAVSTAPLQ